MLLRIKSGVCSSPGQSTHAAANAALDSFAQWRTGSGHSSLSVQWGAWSQIGYAARVGADVRNDSLGIIPSFSPSLGLIVLRTALLRTGVVLVTPLTTAIGQVLPATQGLTQGLSNIILDQAGVPEEKQDLKMQKEDPGRVLVALQGLSAEARTRALQKIVTNKVREAAGVTVEPTDDLVDGGVDSLAAVELNSTLQTLVGSKIKLPANLLMEHPTIQAIAGLIGVGLKSPSPSVTISAPAVDTTVITDGKLISVTGTACRVGGGADNWPRFWSRLCESKCLVSAVLPERWSFAVQATVGNFDPEDGTWKAAFLHEIQLFDHHYFKMTPARAQGMDPTDCILVQTMAEAITDAGYSINDDAISGAALITAVTTSDFKQHARYGVMTPRLIAQLLNIHGHFENIDTICSR